MERLYVYLRNTMKTFRLRLCCCFAPLRPGILFLGYCNIVGAVIQLIGVASSSTLPLIGDVQSTVAEEQTSPTTTVLAPAADLAFNVLLVAAMHRKDVVLLRGYMWCGAAALAAGIVAYSLVLAVLSAFFITRIVLSMVYQIYLIILVRSYIVEIELNRRASQHLYYKSDLSGSDPTAAATLRIVHEVKDAVSRSGTLQRADNTTDSLKREVIPVTVTVTPPPAEEGDSGRKTPEVRQYTSVYGLGRTLGASALSACGSNSQPVSSTPSAKPSTSTDSKTADSKSVVEVKDAEKTKAKTESKDAKKSKDAKLEGDSKDGAKPKSNSKNKGADDSKSATASKSTDESKSAIESKGATDSGATDSKDGGDTVTETSTKDGDKQTEAPPKKKRGLFRRTPKESKAEGQ